MLLLASSSGQKNDSFCWWAKSMQINPLFISPWITQVFALLFGAHELNKIIRKVENVNIYWPVEERDDPALGWQKAPLWQWCEPMKQEYSTLTDQHHRRSNTCKNSAPVKPTLFTPIKEVREPNSVHSWAHILMDKVTGREGWAADGWRHWQIHYYVLSTERYYKINSFICVDFNFLSLILACSAKSLKHSFYFLLLSNHCTAQNCSDFDSQTKQIIFPISSQLWCLCSGCQTVLQYILKYYYVYTYSILYLENTKIFIF